MLEFLPMNMIENKGASRGVLMLKFGTSSGYDIERGNVNGTGLQIGLLCLHSQG